MAETPYPQADAARAKWLASLDAYVAAHSAACARLHAIAAEMQAIGERAGAMAKAVREINNMPPEQLREHLARQTVIDQLRQMVQPTVASP